MDELEQELQIKVRPLSWPINQGQRFKGVYNIYEQRLDLFTPDKQKVTEKVEVDIHSDALEAHVGQADADKLRTDLELVDGVYPEFDVQTYLEAEVAPVFFGSALNNFGVKSYWTASCRLHPARVRRWPKSARSGRKSRSSAVSSSKSQPTSTLTTVHVSPSAKYVPVSSCAMRLTCMYAKTRRCAFLRPHSSWHKRKSTIDEAWPGDIVGLPDNGIFKIGDTLTEGEMIHFRGLPSFSPDMFKYIENADPMKTKQLNKGIEQLMDEGVAQLFVNQFNGRKIIGTVGQLQFEVIQYRLENEYNAKCRWEPVSLYKACWIESDDEAQLEAFKKRKYQFMAKDREGRDVFLADSNYVLQMAQNDFEHIKFHFTSEF